MKRQQVVAKQIDVGDLVISAGGIHGKVVALDDDVAEVEVAPNVVLTFLRRAINVHPGVAQAPEPDPEPEDEWDEPDDRAALPSAGEDPTPPASDDSDPDLPPSGDH